MKKKAFDKKAAMKKKADQKRAFGFSTYLELPSEMKRFVPEKETTLAIDFLPYTVSVENHPDGIPVGETWYTRPFMIHRNVGPNEEKVVCPRSIGEPCPICEKARKMSRDPNVDPQTIKGLWPSERALYNIVLPDDKNPEVMIFDSSTYLFGTKLEREIGRDIDKNADFYEAKGGMTAECSFLHEKKAGFENFPLDRVDFVEREDYGDDDLEGVVDLDKALKVLSYDDLNALFNGAGTIDDDDDEDVEEEAPASRSRRKGKPAPVEEEEDDEDEEPVKPSRRSRKAAPVEEEEEDEEEDDLDMDTPPAKRSRKAAPVEDEDDDEDDEEDDEACVLCKGTGKTRRGKPCPVCSADDEEEEDEEEEPVKPAKRSRKAAPVVEEDDDDEDDDDEEEEAPAPRRRRGKPAPVDDEDEDDDEEEEAPAARPSRRRR